MLFSFLPRFFRKLTTNRFGTTWGFRKDALPLRMLRLEEKVVPANMNRSCSGGPMSAPFQSITWSRPSSDSRRFDPQMSV